MSLYLKKEVLIVLVVFSLILPLVYSFDIIEWFKEGTITGNAAVTVSISVGNNAPNISSVEFDAQTIAPLDGDIRNFEISFLVDDPEGSGNLDNATARANVTYSSYTNQNTTCDSALISGDRINYTCTVQMQYYWTTASNLWNIAAEIADDNGNIVMNDTANFTYSSLTASNSTSSLAWAAVVPSATNQTSTTTMAVENTGNRATLDILTTMIDLGGASGKIIPAANFTVFNSTVGATECDSTNTTEAISYGVLPISGVNNTAKHILLSALAAGQGSTESLYYCLYDVPGDLSSETYSTTAGGSWDISVA